MTTTAPASDLSPAAQAVLDAFLKAPMGQSHVDDDLIAIAAALRAVADQVVPTTIDPRLSTVRSDLMRIARELEGADG